MGDIDDEDEWELNSAEEAALSEDVRISEFQSFHLV